MFYFKELRLLFISLFFVHNVIKILCSVLFCISCLFFIFFHEIIVTALFFLVGFVTALNVDS